MDAAVWTEGGLLEVWLYFKEANCLTIWDAKMGYGRTCTFGEHNGPCRRLPVCLLLSLSDSNRCGHGHG